jgi:hypothetical protein
MKNDGWTVFICCIVVIGGNPKSRKYWVHPLLVKVDKVGSFQTLYEEWRNIENNILAVFVYFRSPVPQFWPLFNKWQKVIPDPWWAHTRGAHGTEVEVRLADVTTVRYINESCEVSSASLCVFKHHSLTLTCTVNVLCGGQFGGYPLPNRLF